MRVPDLASLVDEEASIADTVLRDCQEFDELFVSLLEWLLHALRLYNPVHGHAISRPQLERALFEAHCTVGGRLISEEGLLLVVLREYCRVHKRPVKKRKPFEDGETEGYYTLWLIDLFSALHERWKARL